MIGGQLWGLNYTSGLLLGPPIVDLLAGKPKKVMKVFRASSPIRETLYPTMDSYKLADHYNALLCPKIQWSDRIQRNDDLKDKYWKITTCTSVNRVRDMCNLGVEPNNILYSNFLPHQPNCNPIPISINRKGNP